MYNVGKHGSSRKIKKKKRLKKKIEALSGKAYGKETSKSKRTFVTFFSGIDKEATTST